MHRNSPLRSLAVAAALAFHPPGLTAQVDPELLSGLSWRSIGPAFFGGRVTDIAGVPGDPDVFYFGHASAGVFKTENGGVSWTSVFDTGNTLSVGALGLSPDDPDVLYVGTGEGFIRNSVSFGDGVYGSRDGGRSWSHLGLSDTERIARIVVSPRDPGVVFVAAMGHLFGPNEERGVYRSTDAGRSWERVLYVNATTGAADLAVDPEDPDIVYAAMYDHLRQPWHFRSGGSGSGLYRSEDGGESWVELTDPSLGNGLPGREPIGRIGVAVAAGDPRVVYAVLEAREPGILWRSSDRGATWEVVSSDREIDTRPFYFSRLAVDPVDPDRVYSVSPSLNISDDGGHTFRQVPYGSMFGDNHVTWVDPLDPDRVLAGSDGGLFRSNDRGESWEPLNNVPLAQAYHLSLDLAEPYNVVGGFQDHEMWRGPNELWNRMGVTGGAWRRMRDHGDGMNVAVDPHDSEVVYYSGELGDLTRFDWRRMEERYIQPYPVGSVGYGAGRQEYRFNWDAPIALSPTRPGVLYFGGNVLFRSMDEGQSWETISPDLTSADDSKLELSGGPVNPDNTHAEYYATITAVVESPHDPSVIWVGTDDGHVQLTRDGGASWTNVWTAVPGAPAASSISAIRASPHDPGTVYVAVDQHMLDDFRSHAFATSDYGAHWRSVGEGLAGYVHVVAEDPREAQLLYAGTELGVFVSFDRGGHWTDLRLGLPRLSVMDLAVHPRDNDLVIASHARGFYVLDDVTPLQELARDPTARLALFQPMATVRYVPVSDVSSLGDREWVARNDPYGAEISYFLPAPAGEPVSIEVLDASGRFLRYLPGGRRPGVNRVVWNLSRDACVDVTDQRPSRGARDPSPTVRPGDYTVRLTAVGESREATVRVRPDPRFRVTDAEWDAHDDIVTSITGLQCRIDDGLRRIVETEEGLARLPSSLSPELREQVAALRSELEAVRVELSPDPRDPEHLNLKKKVDDLSAQIQLYSGPPTEPQSAWTAVFTEQLQPLLERLEAALGAGRVLLDEQPPFN